MAERECEICAADLSAPGTARPVALPDEPPVWICVDEGPCDRRAQARGHAELAAMAGVPAEFRQVLAGIVDAVRPEPLAAIGAGPYRVTLYPSLDQFYRAADPRLREFSMERDYGVHWTDPGGRLTGSRWRVSWIYETGEVYAVCQLGGRSRCPVRVYGTVTGVDAAEELLAGWEHECWKPGSLGWLEDRFRGRPAGLAVAGPP